MIWMWVVFVLAVIDGKLEDGLFSRCLNQSLMS